MPCASSDHIAKRIRDAHLSSKGILSASFQALSNISASDSGISQPERSSPSMLSRWISRPSPQSRKNTQSSFCASVCTNSQKCSNFFPSCVFNPRIINAPFQDRDEFPRFSGNHNILCLDIKIDVTLLASPGTGDLFRVSNYNIINDTADFLSIHRVSWVKAEVCRMFSDFLTKLFISFYNTIFQRRIQRLFC